MKDFDSLLKTKTLKRKDYSYVKNIYKVAKATHKNISLEILQELNIKELLNRNIKNKIDNNLLSLWGMLDIKSFLDALSGDTINPYLLNGKQLIPIKDLSEYIYLTDAERILSLIDIKYIKSFELEGINFSNVFLATYEISDGNNFFRPYVTLFTLNNDNQFVEFGYGYDTNDNGNVELFISSYNYLVYLSPKGTINSPLSGKSAKLKISNILTCEEISNLYSK